MPSQRRNYVHLTACNACYERFLQINFNSDFASTSKMGETTEAPQAVTWDPEKRRHGMLHVHNVLRTLWI